MATKDKEVKEATKEVVVAKSTALSTVASFMDESDFGGNGFEGTDKDSFAIPFIQILQKMSPLVDEDNAAYVPGAKAGMLYNSVTKKLYDGKVGVTIIPCAYKRTFIQWGGRDADGGFKGEFAPEMIDAMIADGKIVSIEGKLFKPNEDGSVNEKKNDYYADTRSHFVLLIDDETGEYGQAILSLAGTQTKASRMLMTSLQQKKVEVNGAKRTPPTFANMVKLTTISMSNDKGSWSGASFDLDGLVTDAGLYGEAKAFWQAINSGSAKADYAKAEAPSAAGASSAPAEADKF